MFALRIATAMLIGLNIAMAAPVSEEGDHYLISVESDVFSHQTTQWRSSICDVIQKSLTLSLHSDPTVSCKVRKNLLGVVNVFMDSTLDSYSHIISVKERGDNSVRIAVENRRTPFDSLEPSRVAWTIPPLLEVQRNQALRRHVQQFITFEQEKNRIKHLLLLEAIGDSQAVALRKDGKLFSNETGKMITPEQAFETFSNESPTHRQYLVAGLEIAALLGVGAYNYHFVQLERMKKDWDFGPDWTNRFFTTNQIRFDDNGFMINRDHALAGATYYAAARTNQLSSMESFLASFAASAVWEYLIENREVVSINDMIVTPVGGMVVGESLYQLGHFFARGGDHPVNSVLKYTVGAVETINHWLNGTKPKVAPVDGFGFPTDVWHNFDFFVGYERKSKSNSADSVDATVLGMEVEIVNSPIYGKAGSSKGKVNDTIYTRLYLDSSVVGTDVSAIAKTVLAGYFAQDVKVTEEERLHGYSIFIGPAVGGEYWNKAPAGAAGLGSPGTDFAAVVNVVGGTLDVTSYMKNGVKVRFSIDIFGDFALMHAFAMDEYTSNHSDVGFKSVLRNNYYYGWGVSTAGRAEAEYLNLFAGGEVRSHFVDSIEGKDRYGDVPNDVKSSDSLVRVKGWVGTKIGKNLKTSVSMQQEIRKGDFGPASKTERDTRTMGQIDFAF